MGLKCLRCGICANIQFENWASVVTVPHLGFSVNAYSIVLPMKVLVVERRCWVTHHQQQSCGRQLLCFCMPAMVRGPHGRVFRVPCSEIWGPCFVGRGTTAARVPMPGLPEPSEIPFWAAASWQWVLPAEAALNYTASPRVEDERCFSCFHHVWWGEDLAGLSKVDYFPVMATDCRCTSLWAKCIKSQPGNMSLSVAPFTVF